MSVAVLIVILLAGLLALVPVGRLRAAGWPPPWLLVSWVTYAVAILLVMRFPTLTRYAVPILAVAYVAPFVAGPERLARVLGGRRPEEPRPVKDVTPKPPPALPENRTRTSGRTLRADPPGAEASPAPATDGRASDDAPTGAQVASDPPSPAATDGGDGDGSEAS